MSLSWVEKQSRICNMRGLHARAAAKFVREAGRFRAEVEVIKDGVTVNGCSIMGLLMLAASSGSDILIRASGDEAQKALDALDDLIRRRFDEE